MGVEQRQTSLSNERIDFLSKVLGSWNGETMTLTGGTGVIGQALIRVVDEVCSQAGMKLNVNSLSSSGRPHTSPTRAVSVKPHKVDLANEGFPEIFHDSALIIHASTYGQPAKFREQRLATLALNSKTLLEIFEAKPARALFLSTSEIYSGLVGLVNESQVGATSTTHERAVYIEAKRFGEAAALSESSRHTTYNVARVALAYGPGFSADDERLMYSLIMRGLLEGRVYLRDAGLALRTYCYVDDCADLLICSLLLGKGQIFNVGGIETLSVKQLASHVARQLSVPFTNHAPESSTYNSGPEEVRLDISRILTLSQKETFTSLDKGIARTIAYAQENLMA